MDFKNLSQFGKINFDDDIVFVIKGEEIVYHGEEDYEPMKYENWKWSEKEKCYIFGDFKKYCLI